MTDDEREGHSARETTTAAIGRLRESYRSTLGEYKPLVVALVAIVAVALILRLFALGVRVAHYDEGRVAYWALHFAETGDFAYRYIIHGPVLQHATRWLIPVLGPSDATIRLPVALVGAALLPASVWLFRKHLRRSELVATAGLLALNPVLLYYSRFMRSDLLVATFMFVALGLLVRFVDTRRPRYLYGAAVFVALGFGSKENAVVYLLTWFGAAALLVEHMLYKPDDYDSGVALLATHAQRLASQGRNTLRQAGTSLAHLVGAALVGGLTVLFIYAPRGAGMAGLEYPRGEGGVGLWAAVFDPTKLPALVGTTVDHIADGLAYWFGHSGAPSCSTTGVAGIDLAGLAGVDSITGYPCVLGQFLEVLLVAALPLTALAVVGTLLERYGRGTSRTLVIFTGYAGFASLLGYPVGTDIFGAWLLIHVLVPLSIPAGVALAAIYRRGSIALAHEDSIGAAIAGVVIGLLVVQMLAVSTGVVYTNSAGGDSGLVQGDGNKLVQYAQPENALRGPVEDLDRIAGEHDGTDVIVYGESVTRPAGQTPSLDTRPLCVKWYNPMLPLPWYLSRSDAAVECVRDAETLRNQIGDDPPPIVLTAGEDRTVPTDILEAEYVASEAAIRQGGDRMRTFWIHEDWVAD
ncbi:flippase activity-associated protein Agl23 [Halorhabdus sp. CBA1104]|uniref:flippase activity-associated protein Agl23 n=1 Tax=Halorhabdus sp. CBA1104 TaxID=1380432 RepID=UPI0018A6ACC2|nr:flippase activity-associated protein Agl23 [Halorhabdus sp. CBA1104]